MPDDVAPEGAPSQPAVFDRSAAAAGRAELSGHLGGHLAEIDLLGPGRVASQRCADRDVFVRGGGSRRGAAPRGWAVAGVGAPGGGEAAIRGPGRRWRRLGMGTGVPAWGGTP